MDRVAIILVNWNGYEDTVICLESLLRLDYPDYQIIVVDNASTDGSIARIRDRYPHVLLIPNETNEGFTGGNNRGISYAISAGFDFIMLLNNDTLVPEDLLKALLGSLKKHPKVAAVQPGIAFMHDPTKVWNAGGSWFPLWGYSRTNGYGQPVSAYPPDVSYTDWVTGCCILAQASVWQKIGGLEDRYFAYYEDVEWSLRAREKGYELLLDTQVWIHHKAGASGKVKKKAREGPMLPILHYYNVRNHIWLVRKYTKPVHRLTVWLCQGIKISGYILYFLIRRRFTKLKMTLKGVRDGLS